MAGNLALNIEKMARNAGLIGRRRRRHSAARGRNRPFASTRLQRPLKRAPTPL